MGVRQGELAPPELWGHTMCVTAFILTSNNGSADVVTMGGVPAFGNGVCGASFDNVCAARMFLMRHGFVENSCGSWERED